MSLNITIWSLMLLFGTLQGILLVLAIWLQPKYRTRRNALFTLLLLIITIIQFDHSLRLSELYRVAPKLIYISDALWYLIAPLLLFYVRLFIDRAYAFRWIDGLHLLPFLVMAYYYAPLFGAPPEVKMTILENYKAAGTYGLETNLLILAMMVQMLAYILYSFWCLRLYEAAYKQQFSQNEINQLTGLKNTFRFFLIYFLFEFTFSTLRNFYGYRSTFLDHWSLVVWVGYIYTIAFLILTQPEYVFPKLSVVTATSKGQRNPAEAEALKRFMEQHKPYLNSDLRLPELADALGYSTNQLSSLINRELGVNFYEFINVYRAREARELLENADFSHLSISGIASEAGFKSKTSFYKFFKKEFKMTPREYLRKG